MNREHYEDNVHWRKRQLNTCYELGTITGQNSLTYERKQPLKA